MERQRNPGIGGATTSSALAFTPIHFYHIPRPHIRQSQQLQTALDSRGVNGKFFLMMTDDAHGGRLGRRRPQDISIPQ
jgi:hypothetical protein